MNKAQKQAAASMLKSEEQCMKDIERAYEQALKDIEEEIKRLSEREQTQSVIYQKKYQEALYQQVSDILEDMRVTQYGKISDYLQGCYTDGYLSTMYDLHYQGIPTIMPIDQDQVVKAVKTDSKLSKSLYSSMGKYLGPLKRAVTQEISRGLASSMSWYDIAANIQRRSRIGLSNAQRIARTEGHRIQNASKMDAMRKAKETGADVVKQWDATLDGNTRKSHRELDGQIREIDEPFEVNGHKGQYPGKFGRPEEDINCRCTVLERARWALDEDELKELERRASYFGIDKSKTFDEFREKYLNMNKLADDAGGDVDDIFRPKTLGGAKRGKPMTVEKADGGSPNPNFSKGGAYHINCQTCVVSYEARLRGYNVRATGNKKGSVNSQVARHTNLAWIDPQTGKHPEYIKNDKVKNANQCAKWLRDVVEDGGRYTIEFSWKGRSRSGHIISLSRNSDGNLELYDPQCGEHYVDKTADIVSSQWKRIAETHGEETADRYWKRTYKANPFLEYLKRLKYTASTYGLKYSTAPQLLRVDGMMFDEEICNAILEAAD